MARKKTPLGAIRAKCLECSGGDTQEVKECELTHCPLFPYRLGIDPSAPLELPKEPAAASAGRPASGVVTGPHGSPESRNSRSSRNAREDGDAKDFEDSGEKKRQPLASDQHTLF